MSTCTFGRPTTKKAGEDSPELGQRQVGAVKLSLQGSLLISKGKGGGVFRGREFSTVAFLIAEKRVKRNKATESIAPPSKGEVAKHRVVLLCAEIRE